ncbi:CHRD domain-containing protein [uncultured Croceicoccus sp.]|uniref:cadherin repeat domain-containing protein n=1 Tax=uncultured Croceicoccus sp. TaxID=1295329 RepID=UPI00262707DC|nr:CHRD domain-containing protein [uncultured Croceicoccus sp.]
MMSTDTPTTAAMAGNAAPDTGPAPQQGAAPSANPETRAAEPATPPVANPYYSFAPPTADRQAETAALAAAGLVAQPEPETAETPAPPAQTVLAFVDDEKDEDEEGAEDAAEDLPASASMDWGFQVDAAIAAADAEAVRAAPGEDGEGASALAGMGDGSGTLLAIAGIAAVGAGIYLLVDDDDNDVDIPPPPVNEAPTITSAETIDVDENTPTDTVVYTATATDPENDDITFTLEGDDADAFTIDGDTGEVRFVASPDFEMMDSFDITVVATDSDGATDSQDVSITINDIDEGPTEAQYNTLLNQVAFNLTGDDAYLDAENIFATEFTALNGSGVSGVGIAGYDADSGTVTVTIMAEGLEANQLHPQHIHGFMAGEDGSVMESMVPTLDSDADGDGFIELMEAAGDYGPVLLSLTENGEFPTANADGSLSFTQTYTLPEQDLGENPMLALREFVLHGLTLEAGEGSNGGEADGTAGYKATLPVAAGALDAVDADGGDGIVALIDAFGADGDFASEFGLIASALTGEDAYEEADRFFFTPYTPLNESGVSGIGLVGFDEDTGTITVTIQASGLEAGQVHAQHIHGFMPGEDGSVMESMVPTMDVDDDGDGFIELMEAAGSYGPVLLSLMSDGEFPTADENGNLSFTQSFQLPEQDLGADPMLDLREIVLHGKSLAEGEGSNGGEADGTAGYKGTLPVAAGALDEITALDQVDLQMMIDAFAQGNVQMDMASSASFA